MDWKNPDYVEVFQQRLNALARIRREPECLPTLFAYYREQPWEFINDWGITYDPRNVERGLPAFVPFILFPRQIEWCKWLVAKWKGQKPGITEKSRDGGLSWLAVGMACTLCNFYEGVAIGIGSRKEEYVDKSNAPKAQLVRARWFMEALPKEFRRGWRKEVHSPHMRIMFPETTSFIGGEVGDSIGRGDRTSIYFVDESAHLEHPEQADFALSQTTNCRIDISSANGMNAFAEKRFSGKVDVFTFHWRDDPRKDDAWYAKQCAELSPVVVAQEIDINYRASVEGLVIPSEWVQAAIDADKKLGITIHGAKTGALDVADEGKDKNAFCGGTGVKVDVLEEWSGKGSDIYDTVLRAFHLCDVNGYHSFRYDGDGLGAGVRGDARVINEGRRGQRSIEVVAFRGSAEVVDPEKEIVPGRKNEDFFANLKAQGWWAVRAKFQKTYRWVVEGIKCNPDDIIVIDGKLPLLTKLVMELSQPTYYLNNGGKILIDKAPDGVSSPNLADAVMIRAAPLKQKLIISDDVLKKSRMRG